MNEKEEEYKVGHGKPPKHTQFGRPGGNKPGLTSKAAHALHEANEKAALLYLDLVSAISKQMEEVQNSKTPEKALDLIRGDVLKLLKDVQDRHVGTPKQTVETEVTKRKAPKGLDAFYGKAGENGND